MTNQPIGLPRPFQLDLEVVAGNARDFELWHWGVSPMFDMDASEPGDRSAFALTARSHHFGDVALSTTLSSATRFERSAQVIARSGMDSIMVLLYREGRYELDGERTVAAGDICLLDMTRPSALATTDYRHVSAILPRAMLAPLVPDIDLLHGLVLPAGTPLNGLLTSHLTALLAEAPRLDLSDGRAAAHATAALIAALAGPAAVGRDAARTALFAASLKTARRVIEAHLANPALGPDFLTRQLGMSRATLYRLFEPLGGVGTYIRRQRLMRAFRDLSDRQHRRVRVGTIAARYGFTSDSVFSRAFRQTFGMSPTDLRADIGHGSGRIQGAGAGSFSGLNRWLQGAESFASDAAAPLR